MPLMMAKRSIKPAGALLDAEDPALAEGPSKDGSRPSGPVTLALVAERAGVSINTVSRVLRAPQTVRPRLRRRIDAILEELSYVPNRLAGGLAGARTDLVGVVITSLFYSEFAAVTDELQAALLERGVQVMIGNSRYDADAELRLVRAMLSWRPAAMGIIGVDHHPRVADLLRASGAPTVEIWDVGGEAIDSVVGMDHASIGAMQAAHLMERGCRRLAFLGSLRLHDARARKRLEGARRAVADAGLPPLLQQTEAVGGHPDLGERLARELLAAHADIDAIICNSDVVAFGVLRGLRRLGRRVPEETCVIAFGDNEAGACMQPTLSTVRPPRAAMGRLAAEVMMARIDGAPPRRVVLEAELLARESSGRGGADVTTAASPRS
jgi:LacI family gluconate utilization system Gnt-I transcriptional repressor